MFKKPNISRILIYLAGMIILAIGLTLNTKVTLGVSPVLSVPYVIAEIYALNFADVVFVCYCLFIVIQLIIHGFITRTREQLPVDLLQIIVSLLFTRVMNVVSAHIPVFALECNGFTASLYFRLLMLGTAIILTGIGACLTLNMDLIPNPGDGLVAAIAQALHKSVGTAKNMVDLTCVIISLVLALLSKGEIIGIGIGTLCAALGVGRVIALLNRLIDFTKVK